MPSHLTRNVYLLRLLASHGLLRPCPAALSRRPLALPSRHSPLPLLARRQPRRTFFGVFQKPPRMLKEPEVEPGYDVLLAYRTVEVENARPPPRQDLLKGWRQFMQHKRKDHLRTFNSTQAFLALGLFRHLAATDPDLDGQSGEALSFADLRAALWVTAHKPPRGTAEHHLELAHLLHAEIERRIQHMRDLGIDEDTIKEAVGSKDTADLELFFTALTQYGGSLEAARRLADFRATVARDEPRLVPRVRVLWTLVLRGLAREGREEALLREWKAAEEAKMEYMPPVHEIMTTFFASRDRVDETKYWFEKPVHANWQRSPKAYMEAVRFALRNGEQQWLQPVFEQLINSHPQKEWWNVIFQWAVLVMDKGVEDVKQMMHAMMARSPDGRDGPRPDASTIDALLTAAIEKQNPYLAERFLSLGAELKIRPRASTYILQMDYRLDAKDFGGVQAIYDKLLKGEVAVRQDEDLPVLNKYLRALCAAPEPDLGRVLDITADLEQRHATLEPDTVVALCMAFLRSDNQYDVIDTLSLHTVSYSLEDRAQVRRAFIEYCLDRRVSTARAWDCYSLLRQFFPETEPDERARLMEAFFARRRPDMACFVFGHMRAQGNLAQRPTPDMYVACLEGLGRHPDAESLRMVHNMLKMDTTVHMDTRLYNALMIAYAASEEPDTAVDFWRDITNSAEGPSYNSLAIVFWACELQPYGDRTARQIWQKVQRMDLEVPPDVFWAYCGAIAGSGHLDEVMRLIRGMDASVGYGPGLMTLGVTYNALPSDVKKEQFEAWARAEYPDIWAQLEKKGRTETIMGTKFNIVRDMRA